MSATTTEPDEPATESGAPGGSGRVGSLGSIMTVLVAVWGAVVASFPMDDNSFFTHLATGRLILERGSLPSGDPYTFTATGHDWTVQSWLPSVLYGLAERAGGAVGLRAVMLTTMVVAAVMVWKLAAPARSLSARILVTALALFAVTELWSERPYMVGVLGLGLVWFALEGRLKPLWLLVPVFWVWGNSHGSYPLAVVLIGAVVVGTLVDQRGENAFDVAHELAVLKWTVIGIASAVVGPLFVDVVLFPLSALRNSASFGYITEWNPPDFESVPELAFLLLVFLAVLAAGRLGAARRTVPLAVFVVAALYAQRNVVMAVMVLVPILAEAAPRIGTLAPEDRPSVGRAAVVATTVIGALVGALALVTPVDPFGGYPVAALTFATGDPANDGHLLTEDIVGNLLEVLDGPTGEVFIDDRADMFPTELFEDYVVLVQGGPEWSAILDQYEIDTVVWSAQRPLAGLLAADAGWRVAWADPAGIVAVRRAASAS